MQKKAMKPQVMMNSFRWFSEFLEVVIKVFSTLHNMIGFNF